MIKNFQVRFLFQMCTVYLLTEVNVSGIAPDMKSATVNPMVLPLSQRFIEINIELHAIVILTNMNYLTCNRLFTKI